VIDSTAVLQLVAGLFGLWATGFAIGKSVAWIRAIRGAA
jgi:hypothetical protein